MYFWYIYKYMYLLLSSEPFLLQEVMGRRSFALRRWGRTHGFLEATRGESHSFWERLCGVFCPSMVIFIILHTNLLLSYCVFSVLTVWTCLPTKVLNSWKRSCSLPLRRLKDLAKNRERNPPLCPFLPYCCLFSQEKQILKIAQDNHQCI